MAIENEGAPVADSSPSLVSVIGEMFGDYSDAEPEPEAGSPPVETPESANSSEGTAESEPAGSPPASADPESVPDSSTQSLTDVDPLDGATPLAYTVNGESRTFDGITVLKDGGAIVDPDALAKLQQRISAHDHLYEQQQAQHQKYSDLERLTKWEQTAPDGTKQTLTGAQAVEAMRVNGLQATSALRTIVNVLSDPESFRQLHDVVGSPETGYQLVRNEAAFKQLMREAMLASGEATLQAKAHMATLSVRPPAPDPDAASFAEPTITALMQQAGIANLTPADRAFVQGQFPLYTRPATPQERQAYGHPYVVQPQFIDLLKTLGARAAETAKVATVATDAAKNNQARLAAAAVGKPAARQPARITPTKEPERTRADDFDTMWDRQQAAAAGALRAHAVR